MNEQMWFRESKTSVNLVLKNCCSQKLSKIRNEVQVEARLCLEVTTGHLIFKLQTDFWEYILNWYICTNIIANASVMDWNEENVMSLAAR